MCYKSDTSIGRGRCLLADRDLIRLLGQSTRLDHMQSNPWSIHRNSVPKYYVRAGCRAESVNIPFLNKIHNEWVGMMNKGAFYRARSHAPPGNDRRSESLQSLRLHPTHSFIQAGQCQTQCAKIQFVHTAVSLGLFTHRLCCPKVPRWKARDFRRLKRCGRASGSQNRIA